ncbi:MAG: hypothetical protein KC486_04175, partial [Myxococcales bacterium]|nr:hypothetical protein [Myxococcales bacterium]
MDDAFFDSALRLGRAVDAGELSLAAACDRLGAQASAEGATPAAVLRLFRRAFTGCEEAPSAALTLGQLGVAAVRSLGVAEIDLGAAIGKVHAPALAWFLRAWLAVNAGRPDLAQEDMAAMLGASDRGRDRLDATLLIAVGWERARGFGDAANAYFAAARQVAAIFEPERLRDEGVFGRVRAALRDVFEIPEVWSLAGALPVLHAVLLTRAAQCCVLADEAAAGVRLAWQAAALLKAGAGEHAAGIERRVALNTLSVAQAKAGVLEAAVAAAEESYALAEAAGDVRSQLDAAGLVARHHAQR